MTPPLPIVMDVKHTCYGAREPHTVALTFTRATTGYGTPLGTRLTKLEGVRCDGSPIAVYVGKDGTEVTW